LPSKKPSFPASFQSGLSGDSPVFPQPSLEALA
jgi:hypothetical protein